VSIFVALHHVTHYKYDRPIDLGPQTVRLRPAPHTRTPILSYSLKVTPTNHFVNWQQDPQGNWLARFVFPEKATELKIEVDFSTQMTVVNPFDFFVEPYATSFPFQYTDDLKTELAPYLATSDEGPQFDAYLKDIPRQADSTVNFLVDLNAQLQKKVSYVIRMEPGIQTPEETLACGSGSCRDSAWLLIQIFRHLDNALTDGFRAVSRRCDEHPPRYLGLRNHVGLDHPDPASRLQRGKVICRRLHFIFGSPLRDPDHQRYG